MYTLKGDRPDELPIVVKEISSNGPGVVNRVYRIEISTNNGLLLGSADITDTLDLRKVIGHKHSELLVQGPKDQWGDPIMVLDMDQAWKYVINSRLSLKLLTGGKKSRKAGERRQGLWMASSANAISQSSISLQRDEDVREDDEEDKSSEESEDEALQEAEEEEKKKAKVKAERRFRLRLHTKPHRYSGKKFKTQVFFCGADPTLFNNPQEYFRLKGNHWDYTHQQKMDFYRSKLNDLDVLILFEENRKPKVHQLYALGTEILAMLPEELDTDFSSKYRRETFARWLAARVGLTYTVMEDYHFDFREFSMPGF